MTLDYNIKGPIFEIHINNANSLNSFTIPEFVELADLFDKADNEISTSITLLTSTGKFFSTGANIKYVSKITNKSKLEYFNEISSKNIYLVHRILNHKKLIIVALNGPVIGLTAALICLMDIIYAREDSNINNNCYIQFPFSSIGLINECGVSASLPYRLGLTTSLQAVCLAEKIPLDNLIKNGFISKTFKTDSVENFNNLVIKELLKLSKNLSFDSIFENKKLIKLQFYDQVNLQIVNESMNGLSRWVDERPQNAFKAIALKNKNSKGKL